MMKDADSIGIKKKSVNSSDSGYDWNNPYIELDESTNLSVINLDVSTIRGFQNQLKVKGFSKSNPKTLVINVDLNGESAFEFNGSTIVYSDGSTAQTGNHTVWDKGNIIWNFYDSSKEDYQYRGSIRNNRATHGHVIAPSANLNIGVNLDGTVIADNIRVYGESHRNDFTGEHIFTDNDSEKPETPAQPGQPEEPEKPETPTQPEDPEKPKPIPPREPDDIDNGGNVYPGKTQGTDKNNSAIDEDDRHDSGKGSNISNESKKIPHTGDYRDYYLYIMLLASVFTLSRYKKCLK